MNITDIPLVQMGLFMGRTIFGRDIQEEFIQALASEFRKNNRSSGMNYEKLSLEELEERFTEQFNHHFVLTEAVRNSSEALTQIMKAVTAKRQEAANELV